MINYIYASTDKWGQSKIKLGLGALVRQAVEIGKKIHLLRNTCLSLRFGLLAQIVYQHLGMNLLLDINGGACSTRSDQSCSSLRITDWY